MRNNVRGTELLIPFLQVFLDCLSIEGAFLFSYWLRFHSSLTNIAPVIKGFPPFTVYLWSSWVVILVWLFIFHAMDFYGARRNISRIDEFFGIAKGVTLGMLLVTFVAFFYRGFSYSRLVFIFIWGIGILFLSVSRFSLIVYEKRLHRRGIGLLNAAIVGCSKWGQLIYQKVNRHPGLGIQIRGYVGANPLLSRTLERLGDFEQIGAIAKEHRITVLFLALDEKESPELLRLIQACIGLHIRFYMIPDRVDMMTSRLRVEELEGIPVLKIKDLSITGWDAVFKRFFDIAVSAVTLIVFSPLFAAIAVLIKLGSKGTVFYKQRRVGLDGYEFTLFKFRTMSMEAEKETGPVWTVKEDARVTPIGRILRRTSLDELPQLIQVIMGKMSLVGPRPERRFFVEKFKDRVPKYHERHRVKTGMTGWAQVNGLRGNVPIEDRTKYDIYYVENWSLWFDIKIILMTLWTVVRGENSY
jgi:exopolysaccharide biosynthesis polyprenyl glycosylphosphotransferase